MSISIIASNHYNDTSSLLHLTLVIWTINYFKKINQNRFNKIKLEKTVNDFFLNK